MPGTSKLTVQLNSRPVRRIELRTKVCTEVTTKNKINNSYERIIHYIAFL